MRKIFCKRPRPGGAFSLVEVVLAIGIMAFALVATLALLPVGAESNQNSAEATRAAAIMTTLETDLKNTHPSLNGGKSLIYGLTLPYAMSGASVAVNPSLAAGSYYSVGLDEGERVTPLPQARYQASVVIVKTPSNAMEPVLARLIVAWPGRQAASVSDLTDAGKYRGYVETYVSFPAP